MLSKGARHFSPCRTETGHIFRLTLVLLSTGCAAPQYDGQTDKLISQLQTDVDTQIVSLIALDNKMHALSDKIDPVSRKALTETETNARYDLNTDSYNKVDVDLTALQMRVDAQPSLATPYLHSGIQALRDNLLTGEGSMQATHQKVGILSDTYLKTTRQIVDAQIGALLTRELGLKSGAQSK